MSIQRLDTPAPVIAMYVQATRGKYDLQVYTDSREKLIERVKIEQEKTSVMRSKHYYKYQEMSSERHLYCT